MTLWVIILIPFALFISVIVIRTLLFRPPVSHPVFLDSPAFDSKKTSDHLARMIRIPTVSSRDAAAVDVSRFEEFQRTY